MDAKRCLFCNGYNELVFTALAIAARCITYSNSARLSVCLSVIPWDDLRKIFLGCQRMAKVSNVVEILPKISTNEI